MTKNQEFLMLAVGGILLILGIIKAIESGILIYQYLYLHLQWIP